MRSVRPCKQASTRRAVDASGRLLGLAGKWIAYPLIMTILQVCKAVRALGLSCRYDSGYQEFRIDYPRDDPRWTEDSAYFTTYRDDAIGTAQAMADWRKNV